MAVYSLVLRKSVRNDFKRIDKKDTPSIIRKIEALTHNPRPHNCKKLADEKRAYRIRAGNFRVIYRVDDKEKLIVIEAVSHRKDVYRRR